MFLTLAVLVLAALSIRSYIAYERLSKDPANAIVSKSDRIKRGLTFGFTDFSKILP